MKAMLNKMLDIIGPEHAAVFGILVEKDIRSELFAHLMVHLEGGMSLFLCG
ncbi:unnamed protein product [Absidia cylindrospora]